MAAVMMSRSIPMPLVALSIAPALVLVNLWFGRTIRATSAGFKRTEAGITTVVQRGGMAVGLVQLVGRARDGSGRVLGAGGEGGAGGVWGGGGGRLLPVGRPETVAVGG